MFRAEQVPTFPNGATQTSFIRLLNESLVRDRNRKSQKKVGESCHNAEFNTKLKSQGHFEKFEEELKSTLSNVIGSKGVPLIYVIRKNADPNCDEEILCEDNIFNAVAMSGESFKNDTRLVHQIMLKNVSKESNAYTYIKPSCNERVGMTVKFNPSIIDSIVRSMLLHP